MRCVALVIGLCACGRVGFDAGGDAAAVDAAGPPAMFGNAKPLATLNSPSREFGVSISTDELELYFVSNRGSMFATYVATRTARDVDFGAPQLVMVGGAGTSNEPALARGGLDLWLGAYPMGAAVAHRTAPGAAWSAPVVESTFASFAGVDVGAHDLHVVLHAAADNQLYEAVRADVGSPWSSPALIAELANLHPFQDYAAMTDDGLEIIYQVHDATNGPASIFHAYRPALDQPFGAPELAIVPPPGVSIGDPAVSADGHTLYYSSDELTPGVSDLWIATR